MEPQYRKFYRVLHGWYNLVVFLVGSRTISCPPTTSRGNIVYFYISRPIHFGRLVLFFLVVVVSDATPKSRRTEEAVCVTKFRNRMRKSVTFCRKCGRKIPPEKASSRLLFVGSFGVVASAGLSKSSTCPFCKASRFANAGRSDVKTHTASFLPATLGSRRRLALPRPLPHIFIYLFT